MSAAIAPRRPGRRSATALVVLLAAVFAPPAAAHVLSMSYGSLQLDGSDVRYELRMPLSEVPLEEDRERTLLDAFQVRSDGVQGDRTGDACRDDAGQ